MIPIVYPAFAHCHQRYCISVIKKGRVISPDLFLIFFISKNVQFDEDAVIEATAVAALDDDEDDDEEPAEVLAGEDV